MLDEPGRQGKRFRALDSHLVTKKSPTIAGGALWIGNVYRFWLRRTSPANPSKPPPKSTIVAGSGTVMGALEIAETAATAEELVTSMALATVAATTRILTVRGSMAGFSRR